MISLRSTLCLITIIAMAMATVACNSRGRRRIVRPDAGTPMADAGRVDAGDAGTADDSGPPPDAGPRCDDVDCSALDGDCVVGVCNPADGSCTTMPVSPGTLCDDDDPCTVADVCTDGMCRGAAAECESLTDMCNTGVCDPTDGCVAEPVPDGTPCDDADMCTTEDVCTAGACAGAMTGCVGPRLIPGRTDLVATRDGWSTRCLSWSGRTCLRGQVQMECPVCATYPRCGQWHDITTFNDSDGRCSTSFCGIATGLGTVNSTGTGGTASSPRACGWGSTVHPLCETERATYSPPVTGVSPEHGLLLNDSYCLTGTALRTFDCAGW